MPTIADIHNQVDTAIVGKGSIHLEAQQRDSAGDEEFTRRAESEVAGGSSP